MHLEEALKSPFQGCYKQTLGKSEAQVDDVGHQTGTGDSLEEENLSKLNLQKASLSGAKL